MTSAIDRDFLTIAYGITLDSAIELLDELYQRVMTDDDNTLSHAMYTQLAEATKALLDGNIPLAHEHALTLAALAPATPETETP